MPRFDVLRGEVEVANARPRLIRAKNAYRIAKSELATLLGYNIPETVWEDIPLTLTTKLDIEPYDVNLPRAVLMARKQRAEIAASHAEIQLQKERVINARAGYLPSVDVFAGYSGHNTRYREDFYRDVSGPMAGVALNWDIFDGLLTRGRVVEAKAREARSVVAYEDTVRRIEQEVRTGYSSLVEAREVLESQKKVQERAEEALRLAQSRYEAGSGTQLDVLDAQTSLTQARTTQIQAARNYLVARARLERAIGVDVMQEQAEAQRRETGKP